jgi:hypothetical protein
MVLTNGAGSKQKHELYGLEKWHGRPAREITRKMRVPPQKRTSTMN